MAGVKTAARMEAEEICKRFPDAPNLQLARKLRDEFPLLFASIEQARSCVRLIRGATGKTHKKYATQPRAKGKAGEKPKCPPSFAEPWTPFVVDGCKHVGVMSDIHIPYHSEVAFVSAVEYLAKQNLDTLLLNGDICDFYQISRWQKNPQKRRFSEELKSIKSGIEWMRQEFPKLGLFGRTATTKNDGSILSGIVHQRFTICQAVPFHRCWILRSTVLNTSPISGQ